jgi:DUF917 family protein
MKISKTLAEVDLEDLVIGATILSSGGGGSVENAHMTIRKISEKGLTPHLIDPGRLPSKALVFAPGDVGGGITSEEEKRFESVYKTKIPIKWKLWPWDKWSPASIGELANYLGREPEAFLAMEAGPGSFLSVIYEAAECGKPTVDGDTVGRAVPEMTMSKLYLTNARILASASTSHFGDIIILKQIFNFRRMEDIIRSFASASGGGVGLVSAFEGSAVGRGTIPNSISRCIKLGMRVRTSLRKDLLKTILNETGGKILFEGKMVKVESEPKLGYLFGSYSLTGTGEYRGSKLKIWFKNENHVAWKNGRPVATSPDTITIFDPEKRQGIWNWDEVPKDKELIVLGIPADNIWKTKRGLEVLGPRAFGFDIEYRPVQVVSSF